MTLPFDPLQPDRNFSLSGVNLTTLPRMRPTSQPGAIYSGLRTGANELQALGGAAVSAVGTALGMPGVAKWGAESSAIQSAEADQYRRDDLETNPFREGGAPLGGFAAYQVAKQIPQFLPQLAAAYLTRGRSVPAWMARAGAMVPRAIGGGGLAGAQGFAARKAALEAGEQFAAGAAGAATAGLVPAVGSMYQEALDRGDPTKDDALKAIALAPAYALLDAAQPAGLANLLKKGSAGNIIKRIATAGTVGAVSEMPQEALQTAMELTFRPDIGVVDKMRHVVDAAVAGGVVGGVLGGFGGIRRMKEIPAKHVSNEDMEAVVDDGLDNTPPADAAPVAPNVAPVGPIGEQGDLFAPEPIAPVEAPVTAPVVVPPAAPEQGDLFAEEQAEVAQRTQQIATIREMAQRAAGRKSAFVDQLTATNPVELVQEVERALTQKKPAADVLRIGVSLGMVDREGKPRDLDKEIAAVTQEMWTLGPQAQTNAETAVKLRDAHARVKALRAQKSLLDEVAAQRPPVAPETVVEQTPEEIAAANADNMRELARTAVGRRTQFIAKLNVQNEAEMVNAVIAKLEAGSTSKDVFQLGAFLGLLDAKGNTRDLDAEIATVQQKLANAATPTAQATAEAQLESLLSQQAILKEAAALRSPPTPPVDALPVEEPPVIPTGREAGVVGQGNAPSVVESPREEVPQQIVEAPRQEVVIPQEVVQQEVAPPKADVVSRIQAGEKVSITEIQRELKVGRTKALLIQQQNAPTAPATPDAVEQPKVDVKPISDVLRERILAGEDVTVEEVQRELNIGKVRARAFIRKYRDERGQQDAPVEPPKGWDSIPAGLDDDRVAPPNDIPQWVKDHETDLGGQTVFVQGNVALVKGYNAFNGNPVLVPVMFRDGRGVRFNKSFDAVDPLKFSPTEHTILASAFERLTALDQAKYAAHPEGPFEGATSNVVGTANISESILGYTQQLLAQLGMSDVKVFLISGQDARDAERYNLHGPFAAAQAAGNLRAFGATRQIGAVGARMHYVMLQSGMNDQLMIETLAHEIGHIVEKEAFKAAPLEVKHAIRKDYEEWLAKTKNMTPRQIIESTRNTRMTATLLEMNGDPKTLDPYWTAFNEWFADQVSRWATTEQAPRTLVEQFFSRVGKILRALVATISGKPAVAQSMRKFLNKMSENTTLLTLVTPDDYGENGVSESRMLDRVPAVLNSVKEQVSLLDRARNLSVSARKALNGWQSMTHMATRYKEQMPAVQMLVDAHAEKSTTDAKFSRLFSAAYYAFEQLDKLDRKAAELIGTLMQHTEFEIDPQKTWEEHTWLQDHPDKAALKQRVELANRQFGTLRQKRKADVYLNFRAASEALHFSSLATSLYNLVLTDPAIPHMTLAGFDRDPMAAFREKSALHESPANARDYWRQALTTQAESIRAYIATQRGLADSGTVSEKNTILRRIGPIDVRLKSIDQSIRALDQSPYFHLGRFGDFFVAFSLRTKGETKRVDPLATKKLADRLAAEGFDDIQVSTDSTRTSVYMRVETPSQAAALHKIALELKQGGWLAEGKEILQGRRAMEHAITQVAPEWLTRYIENLKSSPAYEPEEGATPEEIEQLRASRDAALHNARMLWLDMLPDTALSKVMAHRKAVLGYHKDMVRNFAHRMQVGIGALSNLSASVKITESFVQMRKTVNEAKANPNASISDVVALQDIVGELSLRESERPQRSGRDIWDTLRAYNHAYFLGMSPSYVLVNTTQLGVLLWPELAKNHGFVKAFNAIKNVTPMALKIMKATLKSGAALGPKRAADAIITEQALQDAGVPTATAEFIMRVVNTGNIDIGSTSRELGRVAEAKIGSKEDMVLRYAAAAGYYSETLTRLIAALAARDLHGDPETLDAYVNETVNQSMLNYSSWNTARKTGKMGVAGPVSPVMFSFMTYQMQLIEKLYRELSVAFFDRAKSADEKSQARRFLASHMLAMTAVAGTLGLPAASVIARAAEKLIDLFDDDEEPFDAESAWRNLLASMFGKDVGEVLSRGVFRAAGIDIATRAGEQDILPFSKFLTDQRKWGDRWGDWFEQMAGSPFSMMKNVGEGVTKTLNGDVMGGMTALVPNAIKGPLKAYQMSERGYTDAQGNVLPMSAGALNILAQAVGFSPAEKAEYSEAKMAQTVRKGSLTATASRLRQKLAVAVERQDRDAFNDVLKEAQKFDRDNPAYAVVPSLTETLRRRMRARAMARSTDNPLGTNKRDLGAQRLTGFANFGVQQ